MNDFDYSIHYSRFHDESDSHAENIATWQSRVLKPHCPENREIPALDIGCGYGFAMRALRHLGFTSIEGVELSPEQARVARNAGFNVHDTDDTESFLKERPNSYGFILLMDVLEHVPVDKQISILRAIHGALTPSGRLFLTVPNANSLLASRWRYIDFTHYASFTEHTIHFALRNAGFKLINISSEKGIGRFPLKLWRRDGRENLRKWIVRWCWLQVFRSEIPRDEIEDICFDLNLNILAQKDEF